MARGKQASSNSKSNQLASAMANAQNKQPLIKPEHAGAFAQACNKTLQKLCEDNSTTIINVSERFEKLHENMESIQSAHKKRSNWKPENDIVNNFTIDERLKNAEKLIAELIEKHDLQALKNIKVVKEFEGLGLRKQMSDTEKSCALQIPAEAMLTSNSACKNKDFEKFINTDRMTAAMMNVRLALRLIYHRYDKQSEHKAYLDQLPNDYATPLYWQPDDFKCLHTGFEACNEEALTAYKFFTTIARQYLYFLTSFSNIPSLKKFYQHFTWDSYKWAVSTVQTRANQLEKITLGFIPVLELCNTNLKSELVMGRGYTQPQLEEENNNNSDEKAVAKTAEEIKAEEAKELEEVKKLPPAQQKEYAMKKMMAKAAEAQRKMPRITHAELDISSIGNKKSVYFSYTGNANNRTSLQSLIHNALCFKEKVEVTVHLPQSKPLHREKIAYMKSVGGDDFNKEAVLSPLVKIRAADPKSTKEYSLLQMIHFLIVALDKDPESTEDDKAVATKNDSAVEEIKRDDSEEEKVYPFNYKDEELKPKAKQFLKIRLSVLKRYLDKVDYDLFTTSVLRSYVEAKKALFEELIAMVDTV